MPLKNNDFVLVDYTVKIKETNEVIETTREDVAKENKLYREDEVYKPKLMIIGEGRFVKGFEEAVASSEVGESKVVEVEPKKAYGERDPNKVKVLSLRELARNNIVPEPGKFIEIGGVVGLVKSVSGGRVVVDFNHPLAGKVLVFEFKVVKKIDDPVEKIKHLILRRSKRISEENLNVKYLPEEARVEIETPEDILLAEDLQIFKNAVANDIFKYFEEIKQVTFLDHFFKKE